MTSIANNFDRVALNIAQACSAAGRETSQVQLLAVSKTRTPEQLQELYSAGQRHFGENYLQEALDKIEALQALDINWHFIGPIQSNKTKAIAEHFNWVHSVDRLKIAKRLSDQRPAHLPPLNVCLQVNISEEQSKSGCLPGDCLALVQAVAGLPNIALRGLMAIPKASEHLAEQRAAFAAMRSLLEHVKSVAPQLDTLSMGMSGDIAPAIAEGATIVRVGTALFGPRNYGTNA
ncbi:MAG: YggS family pyridoxal phosphate-dependent enzyme [Pseudomonadales bacterium]